MHYGIRSGITRILSYITPLFCPCWSCKALLPDRSDANRRSKAGLYKTPHFTYFCTILGSLLLVTLFCSLKPTVDQQYFAHRRWRSFVLFLFFFASLLWTGSTWTLVNNIRHHWAKTEQNQPPPTPPPPPLPPPTMTFPFTWNRLRRSCFFFQDFM